MIARWISIQDYNRTWEGLPTGYEGTLIGCFAPLYGIAIEQGLFKPFTSRSGGRSD